MPFIASFLFFFFFLMQTNFSYSVPNEISREQFTAALEDIRSIPKCDFKIPTKEYSFDFPLYTKGGDKASYSQEFQELNRKGGMEKSIFILDSATIALYYKATQDYIPLLVRKEIESYQILSRLGLCTQSSPYIGTLTFQGGHKIENAIIVESFHHIVKDGKSRIIELKDSKIRNLYGEQPLFLNKKENFYSVDYNINLFTPFLKDLALWWIIGHPGADEDDALNVILKQESESQVSVRLFLFDMYNYAYQKINEEASVFDEFNKEISDSEIKRYIQKPFRRLYHTLSKLEVSNMFGADANVMKDFSVNLNKFMPYFEEIFSNELSKLRSYASEPL